MRKAAASQEATAAEAPARREVPLTSIRRHTAQRMIESLHTTAQLTLHTEVDVTATVDQHDARKADSRVTYTAILVKIVAAALQNHPLLNAVWNGESIILPGQINIGVAVALDQGLVVPVIRAADQKSLRQVHSELERLVEQARVGTLVPDDLADGTFTITHLGSYRVDAFTPILNPPQTAILGVGRIRKKPAAHNDTIALRPMMGLSLTFDHRVVDGAMSAAFLDQISLALEDARF
ncbi:MAG TPA: dihydrolipoamide acyltransferase [Chloroflexi bacterium]|nr:dihydrolipoamide acyltransferase [Chloroflexota bacterium]